MTSLREQVAEKINTELGGGYGDISLHIADSILTLIAKEAPARIEGSYVGLYSWNKYHNELMKLLGGE